MKSRNKGILFIILAAFCFATMSMFVKLSGDIPVLQKCFFRNIVALVFALIILRKNKIPFRFTKESFGLLLLRAASGTMGMICYFYAIDHLILADASMLQKLTPFFAILFSSVILKERIKPFQCIAICIAFAGSLLIIRPQFSSAQLLAPCAGTLGALFAGLAYTIVRKLGNTGVKSPLIVLFFSMFSCIVCLPYILINFTPMTAEQLVFLFLAGCAAAGGQFSITTAYFNAPAREISVYDYSQVVFAAVWGLLVFRQKPDLLSFIGYAIIILTAFAMYLSGRNSSDDKAKKQI